MKNIQEWQLPKLSRGMNPISRGYESHMLHKTWNVYLHENHKSTKNVGKYSVRPMEHMTIELYIPSTSLQNLAL